MKRFIKFIFSGLLMFILFEVSSQNIAINETGVTAHNSAILDVADTNQGILIPRMALVNRNNISSPATGLLIYQTDNTPGFYYYNGSAWVNIASDNDWTINGNDVSHLLGTAYTTKFSSTYGRIEENLPFPNFVVGDTTLNVKSNSSKPTSYFEDIYDCGGCGSNAIIAYSKNGNAIFAKSDGLIGNYVLHTEGDVLLDSGDVNIANGDVYIKGFIDLDSSNAAAAGAGSIRWDNNDFLGYDGTIWKSLTGGAQGGWGILGNNNVSGVNFIGTTNNQAVDFRTNNIIKVRITTKGVIETLNTGNSVFIGEGAGNSDDLSDNRNVFIGKNSGNANNTGAFNTAIGNSSLYLNTSGTFNTAVGMATLSSNTTGNNNSAFGASSLYSNTTGYENTAIGGNTLFSNTTGNSNTAIGYYSLGANTTGSFNTVTGTGAGGSITTGSSNLAFGYLALSSNSIGSFNVALGVRAGNNITSGFYNVALGFQAGDNISTGSNNIVIGANIDAPNGSASNQLTIGNIIFATGVDGSGIGLSSGSVGIGLNNPSASYKLDIQGDVRLSPTSSSADFILSNIGVEPSLLPSANNFGYVGSSASRIYQGHFTNLTVYGTFTNLSDKKIKENIAPINGALTKILLLEGKTYDLKKEFMNGNPNSSDEKGVEIEESRKNKIGFIAQDLEKILPELVHYNKESELKSVDYIGLIPVLVEAMKEMNNVIENQQKEIEKLTIQMNDKK